MCLTCSIQNSTHPGQYSTCPAQNALALASGPALVSLSALDSLHKGPVMHWVLLHAHNDPIFMLLRLNHDHVIVKYISLSRYVTEKKWYSQSNDVTCDTTKLNKYRKVSNIRRTMVGNNIVDHWDVVGASPVGTAPTTSSFSTWHLASMDWVKTTARRDEKHLCFVIGCVLY